jgi:N-acyl-L-homoserine lactone synthetase
MPSIPSPLVTIRVANSSDIELIQECRFDVYSEMGYIDPADFPEKREYDSYDDYAISVIATTSSSLSAIGTTRLVLGSRGVLPIEDPNHHNVDISPFTNSAEISRLCVRKNFREGKISIGMYRVLFHLGDIHNIETVFAIVDEEFYRTITWLGFPFRQIGEPKEHMGTTIPCVCAVKEIMPALEESETANLLGVTELFRLPFADKILL